MDRRKFRYAHAEAMKETLRSQIQILDDELELLRRALTVLERATPSGLRFADAKGPMEAAKMLLSEDGPQTREQIVEALIQGGAVMGRKRPKGEIMKALSYGLRRRYFLERRDGRIALNRS